MERSAGKILKPFFERQYLHLVAVGVNYSFLLGFHCELLDIRSFIRRIITFLYLTKMILTFDRELLIMADAFW